ncbi:MAG: DoxX family membrane protein [Terrimonas sp.]|nr:DoxX family membrane protein [Terrimonas sp.]
MAMLQKIFLKLITPVSFQQGGISFLLAIPRIICGLLLTIDFGSSKFGMPWTNNEKPLALFHVAGWFPEDVEKFGIPFSLAPVFFAWMGAASETLGGLCWVLGFQTRLASFFIACTMLVAIFFQKWGQGTWGMLPAMGFLWVSLFLLVLGSGKFGVDHLLSKILINQKVKKAI